MTRPDGTSGNGDSGGGIELVPLTDPNEGAFTIFLPQGWQNQAYLVRPHGAPRSVVTALSPGGETLLFFGDPQMPSFSLPTPEMYPGHPLANLNPMMQVHPYVPAEPFFLHYIQQRYGHAPGFRVIGAEPCPEMERAARADARKHGMDAGVTAVTVSFQYEEGGRTVRTRLHGLTMSMMQVWVADVCGIRSTDENPARWDGLLFHIGRSRQTNPHWQQMQNQAHVQKMNQIHWDHQNAMQQMQQNHQNNMAWIQNSAESHQARMDSLHAQADAQVQGWYAQQNASDAAHRNFMDTLTGQNTVGPNAAGGEDFSHRRFLNYITEQETVVGQDGASYQVEAGYDRYFRHKRNDTYVGADAHTSLDDLRKRGLNPDDYEEVRIRR
jgi:hypothetical protein